MDGESRNSEEANSGPLAGGYQQVMLIAGGPESYFLSVLTGASRSK